jgi:uncharacterized heparinase superfamily protein
MSTQALTDKLKGAVRRFRRHRPSLRALRRIEHLAIVPPDLRAADPGFIDEVRDGLFGLGGFVADIGDSSPFDVVAAPVSWHTALHGFAWLRHLEAAGTPDAEVLARDLVDDWLETPGRPGDVRKVPEVVARRVLSWLAHAGLILDVSDRHRYDKVAAALAEDMHLLDGIWRKATPGESRLVAAIARLQARLSCNAREVSRRRAERDLARELSAQILPDGSHISRNADVLVRVLLDLLPLRQCYQARQILMPPIIFATATRIVPFLRYMRHGDGSLARFNGSGHASADELATVVGYDAARTPPPAVALPSGYVRLSALGTIVLVDAAAPPPRSMAHAAHAGCLSFEMSADASPLLSNRVMRATETLDAGDSVRVTSQHSALCIEAQSTGEFGASRQAEPALLMSGAVHAEQPPADGLSFAAVHAGYADRFGLDHTRRLALSPDGARLSGADILVSAKRGAAKPVSFAIHFHPAPSVSLRRGDSPGEVELLPPSGPAWVFRADRALIAIEGVSASNGLHIVLRGAHAGGDEPTVIEWSVARR